ncbi:MAG: hypothetical protein DMD35_13795 [Gemmatimonadetes bacterium]|nr:MAG: hypothetical protein DMD35_13795 [Gemmatimonadota bacterium]
MGSGQGRSRSVRLIAARAPADLLVHEPRAQPLRKNERRTCRRIARVIRNARVQLPGQRDRHVAAAAALDLSTATVKRDWRVARAWLAQALT